MEGFVLCFPHNHRFEETMRGGGRGGGGKMRRRGGPTPPPPHQGMMNNMRLINNGKLPFDVIFFDDIFPRVAPAQDETPLTSVNYSSKGPRK